MSGLVRERLSGWGIRLSFAALLLVFSELVIWQTPTRYTALEWAGLAVLYLALSAVALDLIARLNARDIFSLLLIAGAYGLVNATLISHVTARDLPISLIVRPLGAQPLAFLGALASFQILASGRATGPLEFLIALVAGLLWGIWVRWFPIISDEPIPTVEIGTALAVTGIALVVCGIFRLVQPPVEMYRRDDWLLTPYEWLLPGGALVVALVIGMDRGHISDTGLVIVLTLLVFIGMMFYITQAMRRHDSILAGITPPRRPNLAAWLVLVIPFLLAGWLGYSLPGSDDSSIQSDLLFGVLTGFGVVWLPAVSMVTGVRAFVQLARQGG